ncbi:MAG TPA: hypothetical protein VGK17_13055 [Propionicimonas sp.]
MSSPALSKTRIALGMLMATATLATTGLAGTLALSRNHTTNSDTANNAAGGTTAPASTRQKHPKPAATGQSFTPASKPSTTTRPSHTKTTGS